METDAFVNPRQDAVSQHISLFSQHGRHSPSLFHMKEDVPDSVTLIRANALKTSHPQPVTSPFQETQQTERPTFAVQLKCRLVHGARSVERNGPRTFTVTLIYSRFCLSRMVLQDQWDGNTHRSTALV